MGSEMNNVEETQLTKNKVGGGGEKAPSRRAASRTQRKAEKTPPPPLLRSFVGAAQGAVFAQ